MFGALTGAYEVLGNMEKVASGEITIFSRLQAIQLPDEEDVLPIGKLQEIINTATHGVVNVVDETTGQLRDAYSILDDIYSIWDTLDKNTQEGIAFAAAGVRQKSVFLSLMQNWENVREATETATNSLGSADIENEKYLNSLSGKISQFESKFEELSDTVLNSELLKFFVEFGTTGVEALDAIVSKLKLLGTISTTVAAVYGAKGNRLISYDSSTQSFSTDLFKKTYTIPEEVEQSFGEITRMFNEGLDTSQITENLNVTDQALVRFLNDTEQSDKSFSAFQQYVNDNIDELSSMARQMEFAELRAKALNIALNVAVSVGVNLAINAIVWALDELIVTQNEAIESSAELATQLESMNSDISNLEKEIKTTSDRIAELNSQENLTLIEQSELKKLQDTNLELERELRIKKRLADITQDEASKAAEVVVSKNSYQNINEIGSGGSFASGTKINAIDHAKQYIEESEKYSELIKATQIQQDNLGTITKENKKEFDELGKTLEKYKEKQVKVDTELANAIELLNTQNKTLSDSSAYKEKVESALSDYDNMIGNDMAAQLDHFNEVFNSSKFDDIRDEIISLSEAGNLDAGTLTQYSTLVKALDDIGISAEAAASHLNALNKVGITPPLEDLAPSDIVKNVSEISTQIELLQGVLDDFKSNKSVSFDIIDKIASNEDLSKLQGIDDFLSTISNSSSKFSDIQNAVNKLASELIFTSDAFADVDASNKDMLASLLESIGVTNAAEISNYAYAASTIEAKLANMDLTNVTDAEISRLLAEVGASGQAAQAIMQYVLKKQIAKKESIVALLADESSGFLTLAKSAGVSAAAIGRVQSIKSNFNMSLTKSVASGKGFGALSALTTYSKEMANVGKDIQSEIDNLASNPVKVNIAPSAGKSSKSSGDKSSTDAWKEAFEREYATLQHLRAMDLIDASKYYARLTSLNNAYFKDRTKYLDEYRKYEEEIYKGGTELFEERLTLSENYIEDKNFYDNWGADNEIASIKRILSWMKTEYYQKGLINHKTYTDKVNELYKRIFELQQEEVEKNNKLYEDSLKKQKDGLQTIIDLTVDLIKKETNDQIDALEDQVDAYNNIIKAKKESLTLTEKENSYQDTVTEYSDDISKLQQQADLLSLDDSREAQTKRSELLDQIAEKQKELNKFQHEDAVDKTQDVLDKQAEAFEKEKNEEIKLLKDYLSKSGKLTQDAMDRIDAEGEKLYQDLVEWNLVYGDGITSTVSNAWDSATLALEKYKTTLNAVNSIQNELDILDKGSNNENSSSSKTIGESEKNDIVKQMKENSLAWAAATTNAEKNALSSQNQSLGNKLKNGYDKNIFYESVSGTWWLDYAKKIRLFHNGLKGGIVGGHYTPKQSETYALLKKDEFVINEEDQAQIGERLKTLNKFGELLNSSAFNAPKIMPNNESIKIDVSVPIMIHGNVTPDMKGTLEKLSVEIPEQTIAALETAFQKRGYSSIPSFNK